MRLACRKWRWKGPNRSTRNEWLVRFAPSLLLRVPFRSSCVGTPPCFFVSYKMLPTKTTTPPLLSNKTNRKKFFVLLLLYSTALFFANYTGITKRRLWYQFIICSFRYYLSQCARARCAARHVGGRRRLRRGSATGRAVDVARLLIGRRHGTIHLVHLLLSQFVLAVDYVFVCTLQRAFLFWLKEERALFLFCNCSWIPFHFARPSSRVPWGSLSPRSDWLPLCPYCPSFYFFAFDASPRIFDIAFFPSLKKGGWQVIGLRHHLSTS